MRRGGLVSLLVSGCLGADDGSRAPSDAGPDAAACAYSVLTSTSGRVLGPDGQPFDGATVGFCMRNDVTSVCFAPIPTAADGTYSIEIPEQFSCIEHAVDRLYAEGMAVGYCALDVEGVEGSLEAPDFSLFAHDGPAPDWGTGADDEIVYAASDGAEVTLRRSDVVVHAVETDLRMTYVDPAVQRPCFLPADQDVAALYAMGPETDVLREGGLPARLVDHSGLPPGTPVDLYTQGSLVTALGESPILEGAWEPFAESAVGADGFIETPVSDGLPQLGWIGAVARSP